MDPKEILFLLKNLLSKQWNYKMKITKTITLSTRISIVDRIYNIMIATKVLDLKLNMNL